MESAESAWSPSGRLSSRLKLVKAPACWFSLCARKPGLKGTPAGQAESTDAGGDREVAGRAQCGERGPSTMA